MVWDRATPFVIDLNVGAEDIDGLGHANNAVTSPGWSAAPGGIRSIWAWT
ncbi:4-hydroxybenzoyl-CoA thioesterase [Pseudomonas savastanoi pv. fraxini]|nr:4-hydroxybenzoyl-CoA thioesterase [Pseudomonas savastanoi pv. fraxini]RMR64629.1 4-hydroxybenzoyl-CoA thioesterase [Pseudomonas savastanoi pv. fraxini]RMR68525.1 4-hydroxybenzoyl-CoA thioesterase [Pseudomonas savastanoi pv. fraxini]RMR70758.1 4-hydroxybenzoyl-CoA thioesterase [Pseudomonas savastanoi pv. fraxini]